MKRYSITMMVVALAFLMLSIPACQEQPEEPIHRDENQIIIGFSQVGAESNWRVANTESMKTTFTEENGYDLIYNDARQKQENQIMAIRTFIQQKVDYIVLAPITVDGWDSVLEEARDAGVPVILMDRQVEVSDDSLFTCWVGSDVPQEATVAMDWLEQEVEKRGYTEETPVRILHLMGTPGATSQIYRTKGLEDAVASHENWSLAGQLDGDFTEAKAYEIAKEFLSQDRDIHVIYCENDNMTFGVIHAMDDLGISYGKDGDVILISFDAATPALEACLAGEINLCVECNPLQGPQVAEIIAKLEAGEMPPKHSYVDETYFTAETITQAMIDQRQY